jgi:hypothetical protein
LETLLAFASSPSRCSSSGADSKRAATCSTATISSTRTWNSSGGVYPLSARMARVETWYRRQRIGGFCATHTEVRVRESRQSWIRCLRHPASRCHAEDHGCTIFRRKCPRITLRRSGTRPRTDDGRASAASGARASYARGAGSHRTNSDWRSETACHACRAGHRSRLRGDDQSHDGAACDLSRKGPLLLFFR